MKKAELKMYDFMLSDKKRFVFLLVMMLINSFLMVSISLLTGIVMEFATQGSVFGVEFHVGFIAIFLSVYIFLTLASYMFCFNLINNLILELKYNLEIKLVDAFSKHFNTSEVLNQFNNDINILCESYYRSIFEMLRCLFFIIAALIMSLFYSCYLFIFIILMFSLGVYVQTIFKKAVVNKRIKYQNDRIEFNLFIISYIKSKLTLRCFDKNKFVHKKASEIIAKKADSEGNLDFTTDYKYAYKDADVIILAVGTPERDDGSANLEYLFDACDKIASTINKDTLVVVKSTVPIGTCNSIEKYINEN